MQYIDDCGDTWEDASAGYVRAIVVSGNPVTDAEAFPREHANTVWGPLVPIWADSDEPLSDPFTDLPTVSDVMGRAEVFQAAHALVTGLKWAEDASLYDVLQVAKWLEAGG